MVKWTDHWKTKAKGKFLCKLDGGSRYRTRSDCRECPDLQRCDQEEGIAAGEANIGANGPPEGDGDGTTPGKAGKPTGQSAPGATEHKDGDADGEDGAADRATSTPVRGSRPGREFIEKKHIQVEDVQIDGDLYPRESPNEEHVRDLAGHLGKYDSPIVVSSDLTLVDGYHRITAATQDGVTTIEAEIYRYEDDETLLRHAVELNSRHGLQLTRKEKKAWVRRVWTPDVNSEDLARITAVPIRTVQSWVSDLNTDARQQRDGRIRARLNAGEAVEDVAKELRVSPSTVKHAAAGQKRSSAEMTQGNDIDASAKPAVSTSISKDTGSENGCAGAPLKEADAVPPPDYEGEAAETASCDGIGPPGQEHESKDDGTAPDPIASPTQTSEVDSEPRNSCYELQAPPQPTPDASGATEGASKDYDDRDHVSASEVSTELGNAMSHLDAAMGLAPQCWDLDYHKSRLVMQLNAMISHIGTWRDKLSAQEPRRPASRNRAGRRGHEQAEAS